jgi:formiminotetrahydrofolate cyclodeaminase
MSDSFAKPATAQRTVADYIAALASGAPTPGGGSAVAIAASLAAALGEMVCRFTIGRPAYAMHEAEVTEALDHFQQARQRLLDLATADEAAFDGYARATALPKSTDELREARRSALTDALAVAAGVPLAVAEETLQLLYTLETAARFGNRSVLSDVAVANYLAEAAVHGAVENVDVNAKAMKGPRASELLARGAELRRAAIAQRGAIQTALDDRE